MSKILYTDLMEFSTDELAQAAYVSSDGADILSLQQDATTGSSRNVDGGVGENAEKAGAAFTLSESIICSKVYLKLYKRNSPIDNSILTIETNNGGEPSGTLVNVNATKTIVSSSIPLTAVPGDYIVFEFSTPFPLSADTLYHLVLSRSGARDATNRIAWSHTTSDVLADAYLEALNSGTWAIDTGRDGNFKIYKSPNLQCYSEDTIVQQGTYSLKGIASTDALNETLTKTLTDYLDYSIMDKLIFQVRSSRTGENLQLQIHDTGGTTSSHTINIIEADVWQTETWDLTGINTTDRDTIDKIIIKVINADAENIFYFDDLYSEIDIPMRVKVDYMEYADDDAAQLAYVSDANPIAKATGGDITYDGNYVIHTFLSSTDFIPDSTFDVQYLVVAGGGGGGNVHAGGGGGGAGGFRTNGVYDHEVTTQTYGIIIGAGGAGQEVAVIGHGTIGDNSTFDSITSLGGGYGSGVPDIVGGDGGSGGGGTQNASAGGSGTENQGEDGGAGSALLGDGHETGGGGGGANQIGETGVTDTAGDGGNGLPSSISGSEVYYAGGGGGGLNVSATGDVGSGGNGGGGDGGKRSSSNADNGDVNSGGGGGGSGFSGVSSGNGGSGIVIIRYLGDVLNLQSYSEDTIKQQGSYSLKGIALITDSLNATLTRTVSCPIDLSVTNKILFRIRASRTGHNFDLKIRDDSETWHTKEITIAEVDTWQTEVFDLTNIIGTERDVIDRIQVEIVNADAENIFYIDNIYGTVIAEHSSVWVGG